jgi:hypothetical protein
MFQHTISEASRLRLKIAMHNAPGWCGSGGPWITPALAMQKVVFSKTNLTGPLHFVGALPAPVAVAGYLGEIATVAFPSIVGDGAAVPGFAPTITSSSKSPFQGSNLLDQKLETSVRLPVPSRKEEFIELQFKEPFAANHLDLLGTKQLQSFQGRLQVSNDGKNFSTVREFLNRRTGVALDFDQVSARYFRMVFTKAEAASKILEFSEVALFPVFRIDGAATKAGMGRVKTVNVPFSSVPEHGLIRPEQVVELTSKVNADGRLSWTVPPGQWTVMRFAHTPTGRTNHPAVEGLGLECDKLSKEAIEYHFKAFLGGLIDKAGSQAGGAFLAGHVDSWEHGYQNWTPRFLEEFRTRRGYNLVPYLPTFSGRIVTGLEVSERVLWDVRRTIADLWADNYAGHLAELLHRHGMELSTEAYASGPFDYLTYAARADVPMSEFWAEADDFSRFQTTRCMASAAHTWGKAVVAAEAFTAYPVAAKWQNHPFTLKSLGDAAFTEGVNRIMFHRYAHQPWVDRLPGMTMGRWGVHYERTETWWEQSRAYHQYLARCQFLLQSGLFVADVCYLTDETPYNEPPTRDKLDPALPLGYDYDLAAPEVILNRMRAENGRLVLPDGMNYRVLVLPPTTLMTPVLLRKVKQLLEAGATIVGPKPLRSPSLTDYPACDEEIKKIATEIWDNLDGKTKMERRVGKGTIVWGKPLEAVLAQSGAPRDFEQLTPVRGYPLRRIHRQIGGGDFYFVCNSNAHPVNAECAFRVSGKQPEIWRSDSGQLTKLASWREENGRIILPLKLDAAGSLFIVFRSPSDSDPIVTMTRNGKSDPFLNPSIQPSGEIQMFAEVAGVYQFKTVAGKVFQSEVTLPSVITLAGPWNVSFPRYPEGQGQFTFPTLLSWSEHQNATVKYFSGCATYTYKLQVDAQDLREDLRWHLDLGRVEVIAEVSLNGTNLGILWKPPFRLDITASAKPGENLLEVKIVNLWPNRLIGDEQLPEDCRWRVQDDGACLVEWPQWLLEGKPSPSGRQTFTTWKHWKKDSALLPSGLLGPVTLNPEKRITFLPAQK